MKTQIKSIADELREDLERSPDLRAQQLIDLDETISDMIVKFEQILGPDQGREWAALKEKIDELRKYAQVAKMRLLYGDESLPAKLDAMHSSIADEEVQAAIEVGRDAHKATGVSDIFKALLMWKDTPEERMHKEE
jgi:predicted solute-binding protein